MKALKLASCLSQNNKHDTYSASQLCSKWCGICGQWDLQCDDSTMTRYCTFGTGISCESMQATASELPSPRGKHVKHITVLVGCLYVSHFISNVSHGSLNVPIEHHPTIRYMVFFMATIRWCPIYPKWDIPMKPGVSPGDAQRLPASMATSRTQEPTSPRRSVA